MAYSKPGGSRAACSGRLDSQDCPSLVYRLGGGVATEREAHARRTPVGAHLWAGNSEKHIWISALEKGRTLPCKKFLNSDFQTTDWDPLIRCKVNIMILIIVPIKIKEREEKEIKMNKWETEFCK